MNIILKEVSFGVALLFTISPLAFILRWLLRTYKIGLPKGRAIGACIILTTLITLSYCTFFGLANYFVSEVFHANAFIIAVIGYNIMLAVFGAWIVLFVFLATVFMMILTQLVGWTKKTARID